MIRLTIIAVSLLLPGCKTEPIPRPIPGIVISSPVDNQHFVKGDNIHMVGTVTHTVGLTAVAVHLTDLSTISEFFHYHYGPNNATSFSFDCSYPIPDNVKTTFELEIEATDINGDIVTKEITLLIN